MNLSDHRTRATRFSASDLPSTIVEVMLENKNQASFIPGEHA